MLQFDKYKIIIIENIKEVAGEKGTLDLRFCFQRGRRRVQYGLFKKNTNCA